MRHDSDWEAPTECPECGHRGTIHAYWVKRTFVTCLDCGLNGPGFDAGDEGNPLYREAMTKATRAWNAIPKTWHLGPPPAAP